MILKIFLQKNTIEKTLYTIIILGKYGNFAKFRVRIEIELKKNKKFFFT